MGGLGVIHLLYKVLRYLPVWYRWYTNSLTAPLGSDFRKPYKSVQELYENAFHGRLFDMAW